MEDKVSRKQGVKMSSGEAHEPMAITGLRGNGNSGSAVLGVFGWYELTPYYKSCHCVSPKDLDNVSCYQCWLTTD